MVEVVLAVDAVVVVVLVLLLAMPRRRTRWGEDCTAWVESYTALGASLFCELPRLPALELFIVTEDEAVECSLERGNV